MELRRKRKAPETALSRGVAAAGTAAGGAAAVNLDVDPQAAACPIRIGIEHLQPAAVTVLLNGAAGIYDATTVGFAGVDRRVLLDTGSPLSWVPRASTDEQLRTDGQTDGDSYSDGQQFTGQFSYGAFVIPRSPGCGNPWPGDITIAEAGVLLVDDGSPRGVLGLNRRQVQPFEHGGLPHPGDLITQLLTRLPQPCISFHLDPRQAQASHYQLGPSCAVFGGLIDASGTLIHEESDENGYA